MKMAFIVHNEFYKNQLMKILNGAGIDYYTYWEHAKGKGHGTQPHLGSGGFPSTNDVMMIAFQDEAPLENLIQAIVAANLEIKRPDDRIRLFQMPLERMV